MIIMCMFDPRNYEEFYYGKGKGNHKLLSLNLKCKKMHENSNDYEKSEYVCLVEWIKVTDRDNAKWIPNSKLYTTTHVRASLKNQKDKIKFLESKFGIEFMDYCI